MSLALCAPQSSWFSLSFALRKLFANLGTGTVCGQIFSSECITLFRETHESRIEEGTVECCELCNRSPSSFPVVQSDETRCQSLELK